MIQLNLEIKKEQFILRLPEGSYEKTGNDIKPRYSSITSTTTTNLNNNIYYDYGAGSWGHSGVAWNSNGEYKVTFTF